MSILHGSGKRFSSNARAGNLSQEQAFEPRVRTTEPVPPIAFQGLQTGTELSLGFEPNQALPVDGSNRLLRTLSPFMLQVEPPLVFGNQPTVQDGNTREVGIYEAASRGRNPIFGPTAGSGGFLSSFNASPSSAEVIARNAPDPQVHRSGDGKRTVAADGEGVVGKLGHPAIADLKTAMDIAVQLAAVKNTPPLVLLINPSTLAMVFSKVQQFNDRSRHGYIFQAWGDEQPRLSITAKCGAFLSGGRGVQYASKRDSAAWQNLMSAFHLYRHNGYLYDTVGKSNAHLFVGGLSIHYDGWIYYGNMESFTYAYDDSTNQLGGVEFSMEFVVSVMVDASKASGAVAPMRSPIPNTKDPRYYTPRGTGVPADNPLSIGGTNPRGIRDEINERLHGGTENTPQIWTPNAEGGLPEAGDPDYQEAPAAPQQEGSADIPAGGGFLPAPETESNAATGMADQPLPFGV